jgi:hypothetical protein
MKISLNELVQLLADRVGQPFSVPLQEELKVVFNYKIADWMQKIIDKHPEQRKFFLKDITDELQRVDEAECPVVTGCTVLRTVHQIPTPIRSGTALFDYVGDPDRLDGYTYASPEEILWLTKYNKYTKDRPKWFYLNKYIYIYNEDSLENINIRGLWSDQRQLNQFKCADKPCYTDDDQWDVPADIINTMVQDVLKNELALKNQLRQVLPEEGEVTVDNK